MDKYIEFVFDNNEDMPEWNRDIDRFSDLHSWYKHLGNFNVAYPLLIRGEEPRYPFSPCFTDDNQNNFHWTLVIDYSIDDYKIKINDTDKYIKIPNELKNFMKQFPVYLNNEFSSQKNDINKFFRIMIGQMCEKYWDELIVLKNAKINITI